MTMKLEMNSDYSNDSQSSQDSSTNDYSNPVPSRPSLSLASFDGLNSGVPTRTTATITPTQLRSFEQTYIELTNCRSDQTNHAGFVPPSLTQSNNNYGMLNQMSYCDSGPTSSLHVSPGPFSGSGDSSSSPGLPAPRRRNMGGRRPAKTPTDISPEEEERRKVRRERNKMAAARCRKRRLDHTNELQDETDKLEARRQALQDEYKKLRVEEDQLRAALKSHLPVCRVPSLDQRAASPPDIKPFQETFLSDVRIKNEVVDSDDPVLSLDNGIFTTPNAEKRLFSAANMSLVTNIPVTSVMSLDTPPVMSRPNRPISLNVPLSHNPAQIHNSKASGGNKIAGVEISTPSNGILFNFDSLMDGGTGLTPVHPHPHLCSAQQQRTAPEVAQDSNLVSL